MARSRSLRSARDNNVKKFAKRDWFVALCGSYTIRGETVREMISLRGKSGSPAGAGLSSPEVIAGPGFRGSDPRGKPPKKENPHVEVVSGCHRRRRRAGSRWF